jgi:integrase
MIPDNITTTILLDTRRKKKDNTYPVKLRVTFKRDQRYYKTNYSLSKQDFQKATGDKPRGVYKDIGLDLSRIENKAREVISDLSIFSFEAFDLIFRTKRDDRHNVFYSYERNIERLKSEGRLGTAESYKYSLNSLKEFVGKDKLMFDQVTPKFLENYQRWMLDKSKSITTIGIYLRCLRAIFNEAINTPGMIGKDSYPFGKRKFEIPNGQNIKKAITLDEIKKIFDYECEQGASMQRAQDLWIFSYLCNGVNIKDIALLKYKNIDFDNERITFIRAKTERTSTVNLKPVIIVLLPEIKSIIDRWGNQPQYPDNYVFPIIIEEYSIGQQYARIKQTVKDINKYIDRIAKAVGITKKITTYTARHSFSTVLKRSGASIEFISESLGHSDIKTTESYLDSFEDDMKKEFANRLIPK